MPGQQAGQQPDTRAGIPHIERLVRGPEPTPCPPYQHARAIPLHNGAQCGYRRQGIQAILTVEKSRDPAVAVREGTQHGQAVRQALVTRHPHRAVEMARPGNHADISRLHRPGSQFRRTVRLRPR